MEGQTDYVGIRAFDTFNEKRPFAAKTRCIAPVLSRDSPVATYARATTSEILAK